MTTPTTCPPVNHAAIVRTGSGKIWDALTSAEGLAAWFCTKASVALSEGGAMRLEWRDWGPDAYSGTADAVIRVVEPRRRLAFAWKSHPNHPGSVVDIRLEERGPISVVRLTEAGLEADPAASVANATGWGEAVTLLKFYVEHGVRY